MPTDEPINRIGRPDGGYAARHRELHTGDPDFEGVACPDCASKDLEVVSLFGGAASEVTVKAAILASTGSNGAASFRPRPPSTTDALSRDDRPARAFAPAGPANFFEFKTG